MNRFEQNGEILDRTGIESVLAVIWGPIVPVQKTGAISEYRKNENKFLILEDKDKKAYSIGYISPKLVQKLNEYSITYIRE